MPFPFVSGFLKTFIGRALLLAIQKALKKWLLNGNGFRKYSREYMRRHMTEGEYMLLNRLQEELEKINSRLDQIEDGKPGQIKLETWS